MKTQCFSVMFLLILITFLCQKFWLKCQGIVKFIENYQRIIETGIHGIEKLFATLPTGPDMITLREQVTLKRYLNIGTKACIYCDYDVAAQTYKQAFKLKPTSILQRKHFPRAIKSFILR